MWTWFLCMIVTYLIGSIPFGLLLGWTRGVDIRQQGSRNIGASNVWRILGRRLGLLCFTLDVCKGAGPVIASGAIMGVIGEPFTNITAIQIWIWLGIALIAVLGHMFSIYLGFRGGKGVATGFGAMVAMWPLMTWPALGALIIWAIVFKISGYISVASMLAAIALPALVVAWIYIESTNVDGSNTARFNVGWPLLAGTGIIAILVIWRHRQNILRMATKQEPKYGRLKNAE